ncbi:hypothetical protein BDS110ZK25_84480 [Bradyrhizobium diazoefficiens]|uniref:Uncharacterized protein n=1 Tax=Bradyrhizobium diazoefficiens TaxID=1355477 RepID=A0A810CCU3_9BRAD|nr:hypothetical protein BE61_92370 [Bradyrhizobium elkanii USDA 61]BCA08109.1 hypothetical protein H12S4_90130 [Bradyrhizobium diazoefficiens]BCA16741.1 hypothetical protein BDHF08_85880 [Bradyrhizobium diazoefficiens]BCA25458.1 hypothetical protein BDHH15_86730 [Bradyrhizobium diazoefficiens]BCE26183.1 hypothetical protein XF1B_88640 [Bradyrhizobium diazoefficiens]
MDADGQSAALTTRAVLATNRDCFRLINETPGSFEEFLPFNGRSCAAIGTLKQSDAQPVFEIAQAATKSGLLDSERLCRLAEASVLGRDDRPAQVSKFHRHGRNPRVSCR